jgi:elongation factor P--(R)-beta-lysine ligase
MNFDVASIDMNQSADFRPTACWPNLRLRAEMLRRLRQFFDERGFLEVETPILSADTVVDRHLDPFCISVASDAPQKAPATSSNPQSLIPNPSRLWLQTSPEFAMKRLLAAGAGRIYEVARVFRLDELGPLHNPEFTLVEWYQPGDGMEAGMQLTSDLCEALLSDRHTPSAVAPGIDDADDERTADGTQSAPAAFAAERISYGEAFERYVGIDPHTADGAALAAVTKKLGIEAPGSLSTEDRDGWLDLLMVERIQPHLGLQRPALLYDYPASQAALARVRPGNPPVAERFELYMAGIELANGYHELLDPAELRARNTRVNAERVADGKPALPEDSRLLAAMEAGLPPSVGVALGFDRLVMLAAGAKSIAEVVAFPFDRA